MDSIFNTWCKYADKSSLKLLEEMSQQEKEIYFSDKFKFGANGIRAKRSEGTNVFNIFTVRSLVIAYLDFLKSKYPMHIIKKKGIVIFYDNHPWSFDYACEAAKIISDTNLSVIFSNNIKTLAFMSYSINYYKAIGGMNFSAGHYSNEYNGCKFYGPEGIQLPFDDLLKIRNYIAFKESIFTMRTKGYEKLIIKISPEVEDLYVEKVKRLQYFFTIPRKENILIFSPGAGKRSSILRVLQESGFLVHVYEDEHLSKSVLQNEFHLKSSEETFLGKVFHEHLFDEDYSLIIITDYSEESFKICYKDSENEFQILHDNEIGILVVNYIINMLLVRDPKLLKKQYLICSHLCSKIFSLIAKEHFIQIIWTNPGFKWIGEQILRSQGKEKKQLLFAMDGDGQFLPSNLTLEKDALQTLVIFCDMWNYYLSCHKELNEILDVIHEEYGNFFYKTLVYHLNSEMEKENLIEIFTRKKIVKLGNLKVYSDETIDLGNNSNPLAKLFFDDSSNDSFCIIKFSDLENKFKVYVSICETSIQDADKKIKSIEEAFNLFLKSIF